MLIEYTLCSVSSCTTCPQDVLHSSNFIVHLDCLKIFVKMKILSQYIWSELENLHFNEPSGDADAVGL